MFQRKYITDKHIKDTFNALAAAGEDIDMDMVRDGAEFYDVMIEGVDEGWLKRPDSKLSQEERAAEIACDLLESRIRHGQGRDRHVLEDGRKIITALCRAVSKPNP